MGELMSPSVQSSISSTTSTNLSVEQVEYSKQLAQKLRPIFSSFLTEIGYKTPPKITNDALWEAMLLRARESGVSLDTSYSQKCFELGFMWAAVPYKDNPLPAQVYIGIYTWLALLVDDVAVKEDLEKFPQRFVARERQPNLALQGFADTLLSTYEIWDAVTANGIVTASLGFVNCNALERHAGFQGIVPTAGGRRWPDYFRDSSGVPEAYAFFTYPTEKYPDISMYFEALPDMCTIINLGNDVLSFYKEEVAGEKKNYIHQRATYENRDAIAVVESVAKEVIEASKRIDLVLEGRGRYKQAWTNQLHGALHMHTCTGRYRLNELGLAEEKSCVAPSLVKESLGRIETAWQKVAEVDVSSL
ncbi:Trichodiene synthase [Cytospora mali]|uniref:Trichodiene synthase n=1 Tax=Cytospora mali TaxID=578113 RepID=A0A194VDI0_CYTMA|nr:Trichodiene synthase [Valsa mali var. pyri (nom. inval.)]